MHCRACIPKAIFNNRPGTGVITHCHNTHLRLHVVADVDGTPTAKRKAAGTLMREIEHGLREADKPKPHGMCGPVPTHVMIENPFENILLTSRSALEANAPQHVVQVPEARAVVVLHVHFSNGEARRSQSFCIDNRQGILVAGAHTLPDNMDDLAMIEVHVYNTSKNLFEACFVAEPLAGGVSTTFQNGGMDLALLHITHRFDSEAADRRGVPVSDPSSIAQRLSALPIGTAGYEPRDQVSVIRYPIIEADSSRGCKPKCGRVVACVGSRLHLDLTELQDGDSGSLVINGAGEAIGFLMGRPPDRQYTVCRCAEASSTVSDGWSTADNSVYYAQLLCAEGPRAFLQDALLSNGLSLHLTCDVSVPWGEYKIKQRVHKLEHIQGLPSVHKQAVTEFINLVKDFLNYRRQANSRQTDVQEIQLQVSRVLAKFEAARVDAAASNESGIGISKTLSRTIGETGGRVKLGDSMFVTENKEFCNLKSEPSALKTPTDLGVNLTLSTEVEKLALRRKLTPDIPAKTHNSDVLHNDAAALECRREERLLLRGHEMLLAMFVKERESLLKAQKAHDEAVARLDKERKVIEAARMSNEAARKSNEAEALKLAKEREIHQDAVKKAEALKKKAIKTGCDVKAAKSQEVGAVLAAAAGISIARVQTK